MKRSSQEMLGSTTQRTPAEAVAELDATAGDAGALIPRRWR